MATYYVTVSGLTTNTGLSVNSPWSIGKAFSTATAGDTVYIAPGEYSGNFTVTNTGTSGSNLNFIGDPLLTQNWTGISAGEVSITGFTSNIADPPNTTAIVSITSKSYINFSYITFRGKTLNAAYPNDPAGLLTLNTSSFISFNKCYFDQYNTNAPSVYIRNYTNNLFNFTFTNCIANFIRSTSHMVYILSNQSASTFPCSIKNCLVINGGIYYNFVYVGRTDIPSSVGGSIIQNCTCINGNSAVETMAQSSNKDQVTNCLIACSTGSLLAYASGINENYNRIISGPRTNTPVGANSISGGTYGLEIGASLFYGLPNTQFFNPTPNSQNLAIGTSTGLLSPDIYGVTWANPPGVGSSTYSPLSNQAIYIPSDRTTLNLNIYEGSTSQSIQVYLGQTGLTFNNSNIIVKYAKLNQSSTNVTLANQTPTGSWVSGGFCEIDSVNIPGYYRFDIPDAALSLGTKLLTITFKGYNSSTNGTFVNVNLIKAQLDMTQPVPTSNTAQTVGDALNAARAQGFGKWTINGTTLSLYAPDNTTVVKSFTLDSAKFPSQRI